MLTLLLACVPQKSPPPAGGDSGPADSQPAGPGGGPDSDPGLDSGPGSDSDPTGDTGGAEIDPLSLAAEVDEEALFAAIEALAAFESRYIHHPGNDEARAWLVDALEALGLVVEVQTFTEDGEEVGNVVGVLEGEDPGAIWAYSAHFDSTSNDPLTLAPGADDNASAVAAGLEIARILAGHRRRDTVWFVYTDAEEWGASGAEELVAAWTAQGVELAGIIAPDMIGYWPLGDDDALDILGDAESAWMIADLAAVADALGVANKTWEEHYYCYGDDHTIYQEAGFPAISPMDCVEAHNVRGSGEETPHYHRTTDAPDTLYRPFTARVTGVIAATLGGWAGVR